MKVFVISIKQEKKDGVDRELFLKEEYNSNEGSLEFSEDRDEARQYLSQAAAEKSIAAMRDSRDLIETLSIANCADSWTITKTPLVIKRDL